MAGTTDYKKMLSEKLSEVMDDIGVNEQSVSIRRKGMLLDETLMTLAKSDNFNIYIFGSQSEGSLTTGLDSDHDLLINSRKENLIQDISEWESGFENTLLMLQNDSKLSPGYCYLQLIRPDVNIPVTVADFNEEFMNYCATDNEGKLLVKHNCFQANLSDTDIIFHGPAQTKCFDSQIKVDYVQSLYCKSTLNQVNTWLQKQGKYKWPGKDVLDKCSKSGCFVVAVGSKVSSELEWRISTSLQERYLMFSLNTTQLHCYTLMKIILKTHINPHVQDVLSSFMCKNVLWYCITDSPLDWHSGTLLPYLRMCLVRLKKCIELNNCPHFIIPENNLLAGKMTEVHTRLELLEIMDNLLKNDEHMLFQIQIDDLGRRLKIKLGQLPDCSGIPSAKDITNQIIDKAIVNLCGNLHAVYKHFFKASDSFKCTQDYLSEWLSNLKKYHTLGKDNDPFPHTDTEILHTACKLHIPVMSSILGSVLASRDIACNRSVADRAIKYLEEGKHSDVLSGRLKLISVLYCAGDMNKAKDELCTIKRLLNQFKPCMHLCTCQANGVCEDDADHVMQALKEISLTFVQSHVVLCTHFLRYEINCVPHELKYEILRSFIEEDIHMRTETEKDWMDNIVVDSFPYLTFLWYKICGRLNMKNGQEQAFVSLRTIAYKGRPSHKETILNLLGQCYEQENQPEAAFQCYIDSLKHRRRNNAATWLLCFLLFKLWKQQNKQSMESVVV